MSWEETRAALPSKKEMKTWWADKLYAELTKVRRGVYNSDATQQLKYNLTVTDHYEGNICNELVNRGLDFH